MKFISLCSGIDAASVASAPLGWQCVGFSEIEPFPCAVLAHRYPSVTNFGDMTKYAEWPEQVFIDADAIVGGPPCQAFSMAGKREGLDDARGNLTLTYANLIDHADRIRRAHGKPPVWCLYENVPGLLSDRTNAFGCLLGKLAGEDVPLLPTGGKWTNAGAVFGPARSIAWRILDAQYFGVAQHRRRVFVVASAGTLDPAEVLFESEGVRRDSAPRREPWKGVADVVAPSLTASNDPSRSPQSSEVTQQVYSVLQANLHIAGTLAANGGGTTRPAGNCNEPDFCVTTYRWQNNDAGIVPDDVAATIKAKGTTTDERSVGAICITGEITHALKAEGADASEDGTGRGNPIVPCVAHAFDARQSNCCQYGDRIGALDTHAGTYGVVGNMAVRRLTPVEAERLQGFPDDWTRIPYKGKPASECPDGPRYKALGNSWAVPCVRWIFSRIHNA